MPFIHAVPKQFESVVTLERVGPNESCDDCRQPMPEGSRPCVAFKGRRLCLTCGRQEGLVVAQRRPRETNPILAS